MRRLAIPVLEDRIVERALLAELDHVIPGGGCRTGSAGLQAKALARAVLDPARGYRPVRWKS